MITIVWNPHGFHLIKVLEKDLKFNAGYPNQFRLLRCQLDGITRVRVLAFHWISNFTESMPQCLMKVGEKPGNQE
jgi:hypothetical protein